MPRRLLFLRRVQPHNHMSEGVRKELVVVSSHATANVCKVVVLYVTQYNTNSVTLMHAFASKIHGNNVEKNMEQKSEKTTKMLTKCDVEQT